MRHETTESKSLIDTLPPSFNELAFSWIIWVAATFTAIGIASWATWWWWNKP
jgi:hypothetical protein